MCNENRRSWTIPSLRRISTLFGPLAFALSMAVLATGCGSGGGAPGDTGSGGAGGGATGGAGGGATGGAGGSARALTLDQACTAACAMQAALACTDGAQCKSDCVAQGDIVPGIGLSCKAEYTAMVQCEASVSAAHWTCSTDENVPEPEDGQCNSTVCAWACCVSSLYTTSDIWARCMPSCPAGPGPGPTNGSGGATGAGGSPTTGAGGAGGRPVTGMGGAAGSPVVTGLPAGYPTPTAANAAKCTTVPMAGGVCPGGGAGPVCIECLFGGTTYTVPNVATAAGIAAAGNYLVTVNLGGAAAGQTFVSAESNRGLLSPVTTAAGQSAAYAFVVNVRALEGQPEEANASAGFPGLDLFFSGPTATPPQISGIGYALATPATKPITVFMASDSTECDQTSSAFAGWGQMLPEFFAPPINISNYGDSGESSASFFAKADMWGAIKARWTAGDWVMIQFGHNDKTQTDAEVQANLERYVTDALAANVMPILVSPPARVGTWNGNVLGDQSSLHPASAKGAAAAKSVPFIDLTALSTAWYNTLGSEAAALKFHANGTDATHTNLTGATKLASLIADAIKTQNLGLAKYLRP